MEFKGKPVFELKKKGKSNFIEAMAIVDDPATESNFYMFSKDKDAVHFYSDAPAKMIAGLALIPDKKIYRCSRDEEGNITNERFVYVTAETIKELRDDFMKNKRNANVNFMHISNAIPEDTYLVESFIVASASQQLDLKQRFRIDAPIGSWFVQYFVESPQLWSDIKEFGMKGFSIQGYLNEEATEFILNKNNNKLNYTIMSKLSDKLKSFRTLLTEMEAEVQGFERIAETGEEVLAPAVGEAAVIIKVDVNGEPIESPMPNGTYVMESGDTLVVESGLLVSREPKAEMAVDEEGNPIEDKPAEEAPAEEPAPVEPEPEVSGTTEQELMDEPVVGDPPVSEVVEVTEEALPPAVADMPIGEVVDVTKVGKTYVEVESDGTQITEVVVKSKEVIEAFARITAQDAEIIELRKKLKLPITQPVVNQKDKPVYLASDLAKMTPYERDAISRGLRVIH